MNEVLNFVNEKTKVLLIFKQNQLEIEGKCICPPGLPYCACGAVKKGKNITKKPIIPTKEEMKENSRSKSAKLRIFEKI